MADLWYTYINKKNVIYVVAKKKNASLSGSARQCEKMIRINFV